MKRKKNSLKWLNKLMKISCEDIIKKYHLEYSTTWNFYGLILYDRPIHFFEIGKYNYQVRNSIDWEIITLTEGKQTIRMKQPSFIHIHNTEQLEVHVRTLYYQFTELVETVKRVKEFNKLKEIEADFK